jgi:predicted peptidase
MGRSPIAAFFAFALACGLCAEGAFSADRVSIPPGSQLEYDQDGDFFLRKPTGYASSGSAKFPLLVYLHGASQTRYLKNLYYIGMGYYDPPSFGEQYEAATADEFMRKQPCFVYVPQESGGSWNTKRLISQIEALKSKYRIDADRVYVHGFSMGGAGAPQLANDYYASKGLFFAAIVQLAGASSAPLDAAVAARTSVWLQVGLKEEGSRTVAMARDSYARLKALNPKAVESKETSMVRNILGRSLIESTLTLTRDGVEIAKETEYPDCGHYVTEIAFDDPRLIEWTFRQSLRGR